MEIVKSSLSQSRERAMGVGHGSIQSPSRCAEPVLHKEEELGRSLIV